LSLVEQAKNVLNSEGVSFVENNGEFEFASPTIFFRAIKLLNEAKFMLLISSTTHFKVKKDLLWSMKD
jgi:hypothetical protein